MKYSLRLSFYFILYFTSAHAVVHDIARSLKVLHINSISQSINDKNQITFAGEVEVVIDKKLRVWADRVFVDKAKQILIAESVDHGLVSVEDNTFLILAERFEFDLSKKTGHATKLCLHVDEGYFFAKRAEKINDTDWILEDMSYTACDASYPHWSLCARRAAVHGSYFVRLTGLTFKVGQVPVIGLPRFVVPIQGRSKSGFLMPRFAFDYQYGFGCKQEYYKYLSEHADTTIGVDWRDRKGILAFYEFRWARSPEDYTVLHGHYAIERDRFMRRGKQIVKATDRRYWISGNDFRLWQQIFEATDVCSLVRLDFGTDKRSGYQFFNSTQDVDDEFNNTCIARTIHPKQAVALTMQTATTQRRHFAPLDQQEQKELLPVLKQAHGEQVVLRAVQEREDDVTINHLPHLEWNTGYANFANQFFYRHDVYFDQVAYRQKQIERAYLNSFLVDEQRSLPLSKADVVRFCYQGQLAESCVFADNTFSFFIKPTAQGVSRRARTEHAGHNVLERPFANKGAARLFFEYGAEWALPEGAVHTPDYQWMYTIQPVLQWNFLPKFKQDHWFYLDHWDRAYPKNQLAVGLRNDWTIDDTSVHCNVQQGYDFYKNNDLFVLRPGVRKQHLLPLRIDVGTASSSFQCNAMQEYDWDGFRLLQSEILLGLMVKKIYVSIGYLFQTKALLEARQLLSTIPHFITTNFAIPLGSHGTLSYDGQFYAGQQSKLFFFDGIAPLIHRIRFNYDGHCWGFSIGWEEKKFKEYGIGRNERAIVFSLRLDSLGSFAKKFRSTPHVLTPP